ncbi:hypothetical protein [Vibrio quintilis]|uniref:Uncharacterized protein n=1 Tax=Vibrio quintilis TaxID=1117707 RepID=A0A1M7YZ81_9VIBR|nr:hypothetical protein [Vibrio quintilis]SHO57862.1 hypothetical protein VQ7734_03632 [Vibrio quintilis]
MLFAAIQLCPKGGVILNKTNEIATVPVGDFDSMDAAIDAACSELKCHHLCKGVMSRGRGQSGYLLVTEQELETA